MQGVVEKVLDRYVGEVCMLDSGDVLRVDQAQLETVIPNVRGGLRETGVRDEHGVRQGSVLLWGSLP